MLWFHKIIATLWCRKGPTCRERRKVPPRTKKNRSFFRFFILVARASPRKGLRPERKNPSFFGFGTRFQKLTKWASVRPRIFGPATSWFGVKTTCSRLSSRVESCDPIAWHMQSVKLETDTVCQRLMRAALHGRRSLSEKNARVREAHK